jgi:methylglutaconyl-CoA hydratase
MSNTIARIEFGHPAGNSFVTDMLDRLASELGRLSASEEVAAIVLQSEGEDAFCGGASLNELLAIRTEEEATAFFGGFARVINAMRTCTKPVIGRVQGRAVGGGVGLIAACDYVLATESAAIRLSELSIGLAPLVIGPAVERKAGKSGFAELALAPGEWKNAYWAKDKGLYSMVFEKLSELDKELQYFSENIATISLPALSAMKKMLWEGTDHWDSLLHERAVQSGKLALSAQTKQALQKFRKKD